MTNIKELIYNLLTSLGIEHKLSNSLDNFIVLIIILTIAIISDYLGRKVILNLIGRYVKRSKNTYDDVLLEKKIFNRLSHLVPSIIVYFWIEYAFDNNLNKWIDIIKTLTEVYMVIVVILVFMSLLSALNIIYNKMSNNKSITIKGYIQLANIVVIFTGFLISVSILFDINLIAIFTGLGAFAAVLMLIFQDSIKGLVGGVMLSTNDMVKIGDWISMPKYNADGTVIDVSLNIVKIQNWDKTISTIPTYSMVTESFSNWRGMEESGGRRMKRAIIINIKSIKFLSEDDIAKFKRINYLKEYIENKEQEIAKKNAELGINNDAHINGKSLTNIGTFRIYLENYLKNNENINTNMTLMVRQLPSNEKGLPIEIYVFSKVQEWIKYEQIQSDIFDHIFAIIPVFGLQIFQNPSGDDFNKLSSNKN